MRPRRTLALLALTALGAVAGCDSDQRLAPENATLLSLEVRTASGFTTAADAGRIRIRGPENRTLAIQPGETRTIEGLPPGQYAVALEALLQGQLESFAETNVTVVAGQNRQANLSLDSFTPDFLTVPDQASPGEPFAVQFGSVPGAQTYLVEWDDDPGFSGAQSAQVGGTSAQVTLGSPGAYFIRVRAVNEFGTQGIPTEGEELTVGNDPPEASISQPAEGATFDNGQEVTFQGSAEDPEEGALSGGALVWTSSIDGEIGTGTSFTTSSLSAGAHGITLTATDSHGAAGTDTRDITVGPAAAPEVRIGEQPSSTAEVGDLVALPIILDLSGTGGVEVRDLEVAMGFDTQLFGNQSWALAEAGFTVPEGEGETFVEGTVRIIRAPFTRTADFGSSAVVGTLSVDPAAVGTGLVGIAVVSAADPDGNAISADLFDVVDHEVTIQEATPDVQTLQPGTEATGLSGGVLYFRVPVSGGAAGAPVRVTGEPVGVAGGDGPVRTRFGEPAGGGPRPADAPASRSGFDAASQSGGDAPASHARLLDGLLSDAPPEELPDAVARSVGQTLRIGTSGGTGDADLYVRFGDLPTPNDYDCRPFRASNDELCTFVDPSDGDWFVMIRPFGVQNAYGGLTLQASVFEAVTIATPALPDGVIAIAYQAALEAVEGDGTYEWSHVSGTLPPGLQLAPDGTLSGTPTAAGDYTFTVEVVSASQSDQAQFTVTIGTASVPMAYVFARQPTTPSYVPDGLDGINLSGGPIQITRDGPGSYTVTFGGLGVGALGSSFTVLVNTVAPAPNPDLGQPAAACRMSLVDPAAPLAVQVECENPATGAAQDAGYRVLVLGDGILTGQQAGFSLHHMNGAGSSYTPSGVFSWNSNGAAQTVTPQGAGVFRHEMGIDVTTPFTVSISTLDFQDRAGDGSHACVLGTGEAALVDVRCRDRSGATVDRRHTVLQLQSGRAGEPWAYAFVAGGVNGTFTASSEGSVVGTQQNPGRWRLTFEGMTHPSTPAIVVTPVAQDWAYCSHHRVGSQPLVVDVACYDANGAFVENAFTILVLR